MTSFFDGAIFKDTDGIIMNEDHVELQERTLSDSDVGDDVELPREPPMPDPQPQPREEAAAGIATGTGNEDVEYSVEEAVNAMGFGWFQVKVACIVGFNWMADAFEIMLVSVLSDKLKCEWDLLPYQQAIITTIVFSGYFLGAPLWGLMGDKFGRKVTLLLCSFYIFYFGFLSSFSPNLTWLLILRGLVGMSLGGTSQAVVILAEFLPSKSRGSCLVFIEAFWVIGVLLEISLALLVIPTLGWRYLLVFSSVPLLIFVYLAKFLPESALYQQASGNWSGAMASLEEISRINKKPLPPGKLRKKAELKPKGSFRELFTTKLLATTTLLLIILWFCNAFLYYGNVLLSTELISSGDTCASNAEPELECLSTCKSLDTQGYVDLLVTSLAEFPGIVLTLLVIDTLGRKITMGLEMLVAGVFTFLLLLCIGGLPQLVFIFVIRGLISGAYQALYVYTPEIFPTHVRSVAMGTCVASSRLGAVLTPFVAQILVKQSLVMAVCVYGSFTILASIVSIILPIETKGRILK
ncbi:synaptic vesicle 2-related protein-like isoform X1 [Lytechinus variegatus]|uniref:synaptic vesicle 2-related protein-like isoform X1 n=1 Tax=Lytechinus variegatus TaxID=7654 RepID=UPI001BB2A7E1|nr:synaptic vesicle 2-related protein-like isoform X1 [Lytechinus variegatus]